MLSKTTQRHKRMTMAAFNAKSKEISPTVPSGMPHMKGYITMGAAVLTVVYFAFVYALKDSVSSA